MFGMCYNKRMKKLILIDGNSLVNRAYYATPLFTTKSGIPTNGVFGFLKLMLKIIAEERPEYVAVAFDLKAPTFRHQLYEGYKATRKGMPDELATQMPILKEVLKLMHIQIVEKEGVEADDIIGTLSTRFDVHSIIYTGDRDSFQLVDEKTDVYFTRRGVSDLQKLTLQNFSEETGITPGQVIELKSLMGDKSDNIPGVPGIGEKSAHQLLEQYETLDNLYAHLDELKEGVRKKLADNRELAYLSRQLATIDRNVSLEVSLADCVLQLPFSDAVRQKFAELEFRSLLDLNIFAEEKAVLSPTVKVNLDPTFEDTLQAYANAKRVAFYWGDGVFFSFDGEEYAYRIRKTLLDEGFAEDALMPLVRQILNGSKRIVLWDAKEIMHRLEGYRMGLECGYDDVSLLHYLTDYTGKEEDLIYLLQRNHLPEDAPASGLLRLEEQYRSQLDTEQLRNLYLNVELPLVRVLYEMETEGVQVDVNALDLFAKQYQAELKACTEQLYELAGEQFNLNSPAQLGKILFEKLKLPAPKKNKSGSYSTNVEVLEALSDYEIVQKVLYYRQIQKLSSTYIEGFRPLIDANHRIHTTYHQTMTATGRLSSSNPNLQNIPVRTELGKELRRLFVAREGHVLVDADYSQIELRLLAHCSGCKELIEAYRNGEDIHALTASQVFGVPLKEVTVAQRRSAKAVNFGIIYGISAFGLSNDLKISVKKASEYIDKYFNAYSSVKTYMNENVSFAYAHGYVETLFGRKRYIQELKSASRNLRLFGERAAMNMPLQGSSADIIKIAMNRVSERLRKEKLNAKLILQVHDELIIDSPREEVETVKELLRYEMEHAATLSVPLTVEVNVGVSWYDAK